MTSKPQPAAGRRRALVSLAATTAALTGAAHLPGTVAPSGAAPSPRNLPPASRGRELTEHMQRYYQRARY